MVICVRLAPHRDRQKKSSHLNSMRTPRTFYGPLFEANSQIFTWSCMIDTIVNKAQLYLIAVWAYARKVVIQFEQEYAVLTNCMSN